jgi:branched-chain amino acid transport system substrate-binding protein
MKKYFIYSVLLLAIVILSFVVWTKIDNFKDNDPIHIAFVGPLSGKDANQGQSMRQALKIYIDYINKQRQGQQKKIILDSFDDKNDPNTAIEVAMDIVNSQAVAVIGHRRSDCSIEAGKVYKKYGIPAITPTSSVMKVTRDNKWYFRTFFDNELQGRLLAKYANEFLLQPNDPVSIIRIDTPYGQELAKVFRKTLKKMGVKVKYQWELPEHELKQKQEIAKLVNFLRTKDDAGLIFLATQHNEGVKLVKSIKEAGIENTLIAPDSYANFPEAFKNYAKEKKTPGYYTDGIYVVAFLLDVSNKYANWFNSKYQQKTHQNLPSAAFYAVDAARVIIEAIRQTKHQEQEPQELKSFRKELRNTIASFDTPEKAIEGTTGLNYFDKQGNISKPISMGLYKNNHLISAPRQLINANEKEQQYKTVVYTGVQFHDIHDIDLNTFTYTPNFSLWFRFKKENNGEVIKPQDIKFINAVTSSQQMPAEKIELKQPLIEEETIDGYTYLLYKINDISFKEIYPSHNAFIVKHALGVSFHHRHLDKNKLIYVHDVLGSKQEKKLFLDNTLNNKKQNLISLTNWNVASTHFFSDIIEKEPLGNPKYLGENAIEYSSFNANVVIKSNAYAYHNLISPQFAPEFFIFTGIVTLFLIIVSYTQSKYLKLLWFIQTIFAFLLLMAMEVFMESLKLNIETIRLIVITIFKILWWLIPAILLNVAVKRFVWMPLAKKTGRSLPILVRFLVSFIIYSLALFGVIAFVFEHPTTSLLATGGLLAGVFSFAQQTSLSNIFSGIALSVERSFRVGDWVKIGNFEDGKVVDINWRTTKIQTGNDYLISIPNKVVSASDIHNFSYPDNQYWLQFNVPIDPKHDPRMIEDIIIKAIFSVEENIVKDAQPYILLENTKGRTTSNYAVFFKTENYQHKSTVLRNVWQHIWVYLSQAGIIVPSKPQEKDEPKKPVAFTSAELKQVLTKEHFQNMVPSKM